MALTRTYADVVKVLRKSTCAPVPQASAQLTISKDLSMLRKNYTTPKNHTTPDLGNTTRTTSWRGTTGDTSYMMNMRTTSIVIKDLRKSAAPVLQANPVCQPKVSKDKRKNREVYATSNRLRCSDESADATDACKPKPEGEDDRDVVVFEKERHLDDEQELAVDEVLDEALDAITNADEENWQVATAFAENLVAETMKHVLEESLEDVLDVSSNLSEDECRFDAEEELAVDEVLDDALDDITSDDEVEWQAATAFKESLVQATMERGFVDLKQGQAAARGSEVGCMVSRVLDSIVDELEVEEAAAEAAHRTACTAAEAACTANLICKAWEKKAGQVINKVLLHTLHLIWAKDTIAAQEEQNAQRRKKIPGPEDCLSVKYDCVEGLRSVVQDMLREGEVAHVPGVM